MGNIRYNRHSAIVRVLEKIVTTVSAARKQSAANLMRFTAFKVNFKSLHFFLLASFIEK